MQIKAIARIQETADANVKDAASFIELTFKKAGIIDAKAKPMGQEMVELRFRAVADTAYITFILNKGKVEVDTFDFRLLDALPEAKYTVLDKMRDTKGLNSTVLSKALIKAAEHLNEVARGHQELAAILQRVDRALTALAHAASRNAEGRM